MLNNKKTMRMSVYTYNQKQCPQQCGFHSNVQVLWEADGKGICIGENLSQSPRKLFPNFSDVELLVTRSDLEDNYSSTTTF